MRSNSLFIYFLFFTVLVGFGQQIDYRSAENDMYWANRPHNAEYWQQDVHYTIKAQIDKETEQIKSSEYRLVYFNNSPDTLDQLFFHLFQNSFTPGSHMHDLYTNNDWFIEFGKYEAQGLGTKVENLKVDGEEVKTKLDFSILNVQLNKRLMPGDSLVVTCDFTTYFDHGTFRRRMKTFEVSEQQKHFDGVHWYPSIAVYDRKFGWTTEQHLDKEFYHNFGQFDVELTFPNEYIVEATGHLLNQSEVLPDSVRKRIDLSYEAPLEEDSTYIIRPVKDSTKTWKYKAINVHNFAFTADPSYRIGELEWKGIKVITLARKENAKNWQESGEFTRQVIETYSTDFGMYAWPKIIIADANDGMEYPMLTLDAGSFPSHRGLLAHEVGHMWFYGMVGSNETYRAFMDEGFTQFLTVWSMDKIVGEDLPASSAGYKQLQQFKKTNNTRYGRLYYPYIAYVWEGVDHTLNTHSSDFNGAVRHDGSYGLVYYKTGVMLYNLCYVLGDDLFLDAMKYYFAKWKMKHPYPEDFRQSIIEYTKVDLNWFFDQWLETTKYIDYTIKKAKQLDDSTYTIEFERKGEMQMPIDFTVYTKAGDTLNYHIPNTWFEKQTSAEILPMWYGWGNIHKTHSVQISCSEIAAIEIDPEHYLADIDLSNNTWHGAPKFVIDHRVPNKPNWHAAEKFIRPDAWYNGVDGVQLGVHLEGNYFSRKHNYSLDLWGNTTLLKQIDEKGSRPISFKFKNKGYLKPFDYRVRAEQEIAYMGGVFKTKFTLNKDFRKQGIRNPDYTKVSLSHSTLTMDLHKTAYQLYDSSWSKQQNNFIELEILKHRDFSDGTRDFLLTLRTPGLFSEYDFSFLQGSYLYKTEMKRIDFNVRFFGRMAYSFSQQVPLESQLGVTGASAEEMFDNKYTRAYGTVPPALLDNMHLSGGMNLRGFGAVLNKGQYTSTLSGAAVNVDVDFTRVFKAQRNYRRRFYFNTYAFSDMGIMHNQEFSEPLLDVGVGISGTWKHKYLKINPFTLRVELPLVVRLGEQDLSKQQVVVGIGKYF